MIGGIFHPIIWGSGFFFVSLYLKSFCICINVLLLWLCLLDLCFMDYMDFTFNLPGTTDGK